jgi:hypothetical protein
MRLLCAQMLSHTLLATAPLPSMLAPADAPAIFAYAPAPSMLANAAAPACLLVFYLKAVWARVKSVAALKKQYAMDKV